MMKRLSCDEYKRYLPAYSDRELPPLLRRRVAMHLEKCESCYASYVRQREVSRELAQQVPLIGRADAPRLNKIWTAVQGEMAHPRRAALRRIPARYPMAVIILVVGLLLPSFGFQALSQHQVAMALPAPPAPTEPIEKTSQAVATAACACGSHVISTQSPEVTPPAQPNYAPDLISTQAP